MTTILMITSEVIETLQKHIYNILGEDNLIVRGSTLFAEDPGGIIYSCTREAGRPN